MTHKQDRRSQRTRHLLGRALVELILEKGYSAIRVRDLIERANVGRSTFYAHFRDNDDLFASSMEHLIEALDGDGAGNPEFPFLPSLGLFRHVGERYELYKSLVWSAGMDQLIKNMQKSLSQRIAQGIRDSDQTSTIPTPLLASFIAGSFLTLMKWWLENKMIQSPEEMDGVFQRLTRSGIEAQISTP